MERMKKVDKALLDLRGQYEWVCVWARVFAFLRTCTVIVLVLVAIDLVFQWGSWARLGLDLAAVLGVAFLAFALAKRARREARDRRGLAMMIEGKHDDLDNVLINAVEFADALSSGGKGASAALMKREIARAEERVTAVEPAECAPRDALVRERRIALGVLGGVVATVLLGHSVYWAILPRYLDPFGDHPPFSFTRFDVDPKEARVFYGEDLTTRVRVIGPMPQDLALCTKGADGIETRMALLRSDEREYFQKIENLRANLAYCVRGYRCRSKWQRVQVVLHPRFERVLATCEYPAYTHLGPRTETVGKAGVEGVKGTKITLEVTSNRPLASGTIALTPADVYGAEPCPMKADAKKVTGGFAIAKTGTFALSLTDTDGIASRDKFKRPVRLLADRAPTISFVEPATDAMATPDYEITTEVEAEDDYGLSRVTMHHRVNEGTWQSKTVEVKKQPRRAMTHTEFLDLKELGAKAGDVIEYYATAHDTFPNGPRSADTKAYKIEVMSLEEYQKLVRQEQTIEDLLRKYEDVRDEIQELAEKQKRLEQQVAEMQEKAEQAAKEGKELGKADQERLKDVTDEQERLKEQTESLARRLEQMAKQPPLYDVEKAFQKKLEQMAEQLKQVAKKDMQQASKQMQDAQKQQGKGKQKECASRLSKSQGAQRKAASSLSRIAGTMNREVNKPLEKMADVLRLYGDAERFKELTRQQKDLVKRMERFRGKDPNNATRADRQKMKELAEEQRAIQNELENLQEDIQKHGKALKKDFPHLSQAAKQLADEIDKKGIRKKMSDAAGLMRLGAGEHGHGSAKKALEGMEKMGQKCDQSGKGNAKCPFGNGSMERMMGMKKGETGATVEQFLAALRERLGKSGFGRSGGAGEGEGGRYGEVRSVPLYGPNSESGGESVSGRKRDPKPPKSPDKAGHPGRDATEQMRVENRSIEFTSKGGEKYADEYKRLVEEYFKVVAEEEDE